MYNSAVYQLEKKKSRFHGFLWMAEFCIRNNIRGSTSGSQFDKFGWVAASKAMYKDWFSAWIEKTGYSMAEITKLSWLCKYFTTEKVCDDTGCCRQNNEDGTS